MKIEHAPHAKAHQSYHTADGTKVPSVTTVLRIMEKPLLVWANNLGLEGYEVGAYTQAQARVGTLAHALITADVRGLSLPEARDFTPEELDRAFTCLRSFRKWREGHDLQPIQVEEAYVSEAHRFGGTLDFYGILDGRHGIIDFKTSADIYFEQKVQSCTYGGMLRELGHRVDFAGILALPRAGENTWLEWYTSDIDSRYQLFLAALDLYRIKDTVETEESGKVKIPRKVKTLPSVRVLLGRPQQAVEGEGSVPTQPGESE